MNHLQYKIGTQSGIGKQTSEENFEFLKFLQLSNEQALQSTFTNLPGDQNEHFKSDLVSGVYEGGLKVWECALDLVDYIKFNASQFAGKRVLELGCGQGLPGIMCLKSQAEHVVLQDYNKDVIQNATYQACSLNEIDLNRVDLVHGSWEHFLQTKPEWQESFDVILMAETLYNQAYYPGLLQLVKFCLREHGICYIGTKTFYFGLGGGYYELIQFLEKNPEFGLKCEIEHRLNDGNSIERLILKMTHGVQQKEGDAEMEENDFQLQF